MKFQSTRPRGARPEGTWTRAQSGRFQSTRPRGARLVDGLQGYLVSAFQSTRPRGARPCRPSLTPRGSCFNPRARAGRDGARRGRDHHGETGFNPRARAGRDPLHCSGTLEPVAVSIHAPARGATRNDYQQLCRAIRFNPRARAGRDWVPIPKPAAGGVFQSTRPRGARRARGPRAAARQRVSIHAPARGATCPDSHRSTPVSVFQSTRPRGARQDGGAAVRGRVLVSIHAPARGATALAAAGLPTEGLFQSTRPRGARPSCSMSRKIRVMFQSTRPRGARRPVMLEWLGEVSVSIHAPARGATCLSLRRGYPTLCFNPRARAGRDVDLVAEAVELLEVSIHAPARGATATLLSQSSFLSSFNPRARAGRDDRRDGQGDQTTPVSIHAPARGATNINGGNAVFYAFQSTRPRGARQGRSVPAAYGDGVSIHAPARGATGREIVAYRATACFNPRARAGRDKPRPRCASTRRCFNPRARAGRDLIGILILVVTHWFQSTRPRGARPARGRVPAGSRDVSIHAPARGATLARSHARTTTLWFQSTRPRGARHASAAIS